MRCCSSYHVAPSEGCPLTFFLFNDQITILFFPPGWTASLETPIASGGNVLSVGHILMKVQCHSLKK